ncbi:MAG: DUF4147 domain-containing protein, partial [Bacteroidales bacterium]|nr:DUF4147 domain-containing protein [Bacteroidales bacterium]
MSVSEISKVGSIIGAAIKAADPFTAVGRIINCSQTHIQIGDWEDSLDSFDSIHVIGLGKAAYLMA